MQKKIMLALIMSSNGMILCQQPVATSVAPGQAQGQPSKEKPSEILPATAPAPTAQTVPIAAASASALPLTPAVEVPVQPAAVPVETPAPIQAPTPVSQPTEQPAQPKIEEFKPQPEEAEEEIEIKGIDTVDINEAKGNWLYKRIWWEKAEHTYEKIKQLTDKILESRMLFFVKRNELDRMIIEFYSDLGFRQGELTELVSFMTRQLEQERKAEGSLDDKERELLDLLTQEKKNIEQLQQGTHNIKKIDEAIEDAMMKLLEQLNQAKYYEQQAWQSFKAINRELSDKKARELFYGMDTYWRNLNSINSYLSDAYAKYFDQLSQKIVQETDKIKTNVQALAEKGITLQAQALAMRQECKMPLKEEAQPEEPEPSTGLFGTLWGWVKAPFSAVGSLFGGMFGWVSGLFGGSESDDLVLAKPPRSAAKEVSEIAEEPS